MSLSNGAPFKSFNSEMKLREDALLNSARGVARRTAVVVSEKRRVRVREPVLVLSG
jgi:hypothetical protein